MALPPAAAGIPADAGPPAGAEGPPAAPVPPAMPLQPTTYRELFCDAANSPAPDRLAQYLRGYRFVDGGAGPVPAPATLRDQTVVLSDRQPMAFLCLSGGPGGAREVTVVHRLMKYMDMPGEPESGFHDRVLGINGDIMPHQYPIVDVPKNTLFHLSGTPVRVPTTDGMVALMPTWGDHTIPLGPYTEEDPETEVVRPRNIQIVPGVYAALLVHRHGVTAKMAFQELHGAMQARQEVEACQDVLSWLKAACTARGGEGLQNTVPVVYQQLTPVHLPPDVYQYVISKVRMDLPALATPNPMTTEVTGTLAGALRALTSRVGEQGGEDRATRAPKNISEYYKETYRTLLRFCNVTSADAVAPLWRRLANCTKSEQHTIIVQEFQRVCSARGLSTEFYVPVVTASLKQMIVGFQFVGHGMDDLSSGCQPFMVVFSGSTKHRQALEAASVGNQLSQGDHSASLADYVTLRAGEKIKFPHDIMEVGITTGRYAVLCQALFQGVGPDNPLVNLMWKLFAEV